MRTQLTAGLLALALGAAVPGEAQPQQEAGAPGERWLHVHVEEEDGTGARINLPLAVLDVALEGGAPGELRDLEVRPGDVPVEDLRRMWSELRDTDDADFVDVRDGDQHVRLYKRGDRVHVRVEEEGRETVRVEAPVSLVDALLAGEDRLDMAAAVRELAAIGQHDVVRVQDRGTRVRIWIDDSAGTTGGQESGP